MLPWYDLYSYGLTSYSTVALPWHGLDHDGLCSYCTAALPRHDLQVETEKMLDLHHHAPCPATFTGESGHPCDCCAVCTQAYSSHIFDWTTPFVWLRKHMAYMKDTHIYKHLYTHVDTYIQRMAQSVYTHLSTRVNIHIYTHVCTHSASGTKEWRTVFCMTGAFDRCVQTRA